MRLVVFSATALVVVVSVCVAGHRSDQWPLREQETLQKTLKLSGEPNRIVIDNLEGYVHVTGTSGTEVKLTAHKSIHADTESDLQQAKKEVELKMAENPGSVSVYYDAPWRCDGRNHGCQNNERRFYEVAFDIDVQVPRDARLFVSTVNNGDLKVDNTAGPLEVSNVNGGVEIGEAAGSGTISTVNGPITVRFTRNPSSASSFKTVNGNVEVYFQPGLSADLLFKTFNGEVFTDFDVQPRAVPATHVQEHNGKYVYRSDSAGGRVGQGGAQLSFDTLNGNIRLHQTH
jgi:hypothetical protein